MASFNKTRSDQGADSAPLITLLPFMQRKPDFLHSARLCKNPGAHFQIF